jgi:hypothetical protein
MKSKQVFSDSREGIISLQKRKIYKINNVRTLSPDLFLQPIKGVDTSYLGRDDNKLLSLMELLLPISEEIFSKCIEKKFSNNFAALISSEIYSLFRKISFLIPITNKDLDSDDNLIIDVVYNKKSIHLGDRKFIYDVFKENTVNFLHKSKKKKKEKDLTRLEIIKTSTLKDLEFFFWKKVSKFHPNKISKGTILYNRYSSLLSESLIHLARSGFRLEKIELPFIKPIEVDQEVINFLDKVVVRKVKDLLISNLGKRKSNILINIFRTDLLYSLSHYYAAKKYWNTQLKYFRSIKTNAFCHSFVVGPIWHALVEIFIQNKIVVCSFQHGHGREFSGITQYMKSFNEMVSSNLFFCYSKKSKEISMVNKNAIAKAYAVGLPHFYNYDHSFYVESLQKTDFMYISTCLYSYNIMGIQTMTWSDLKKAKVEISIIENILSKIKKKCIYKAYPMKSNLDDGLIKNKVKNYNNLIYIDFSYDLNIIKNHSKILITSRATSTLGWCLASRKPVIFINYKDHFPVNKEFKDDAIGSLFYFEYKQIGFKEKLLALMNKPIDEIYFEWNQMEAKRLLLWKKYFALDSFHEESRAGKRASEIIKNQLK